MALFSTLAGHRQPGAGTRREQRLGGPAPAEALPPLSHPRRGGRRRRAPPGLGAATETRPGTRAGQADPRQGPARPPAAEGRRAREASGWAGLSPSGRPAPRESLSAPAAAAQLGLPASPRPPRGAHLAPRAPAPRPHPPWSYLLGKREQRGRHFPADSDSQRPGGGGSARAHCSRGWGDARAAEPGRRWGCDRAAHA